MTSISKTTYARERTLTWTVAGCAVLFLYAIAAGVFSLVGWNLFVVVLGLFVAPLVGVGATAMLVRSRRGRSRSSPS